MHDIVDLEGRGLPGVFIASSEFDDAAMAQSQSLGVTPRWVLVPHPIQDRTDDELRAMADTAYREVVAAVTAQP